MKPSKHEIQKKKWDKLRKRRLLQSLLIGGCSALVFAGIGVGVGYAVWHNFNKKSKDFSFNAHYVGQHITANKAIENGQSYFQITNNNLIGKSFSIENLPTGISVTRYTINGSNRIYLQGSAMVEGSFTIIITINDYSAYTSINVVEDTSVPGFMTYQFGELHLGEVPANCFIQLHPYNGAILSEKDYSIAGAPTWMSTTGKINNLNRIIINQAPDKIEHLQIYISVEGFLNSAMCDLLISSSIRYDIDGSNWQGAMGELRFETEESTMSVRYQGISEEQEFQSNGYLVIPDTVWYNNDEYTVVGFESDCFNGNSSIKGDLFFNTKHMADIGKRAFQNMNELTNVFFTNTIDGHEIGIDEEAFDDCENMAQFVFSNAITNIGNRTFNNDVNTNFSVSGQSLELNSVEGSAFSNCEYLTKEFIYNGINSINGQTKRGDGIKFAGFEPDEYHGATCLIAGDVTKLENNVQNFTIFNSSIEDMDTSLFQECCSIENFDFTSWTSLKRIGNATFLHCTRLDSIDLSNTQVSTIGVIAFEECSNLQVVKFSTNEVLKSVFAPWGGIQRNAIGVEAFKDCEKLKTIIYNSNQSDNDFTIGTNAFFGLPGSGKLQGAIETARANIKSKMVETNLPDNWSWL